MFNFQPYDLEFKVYYIFCLKNNNLHVCTQSWAKLKLSNLFSGKEGQVANRRRHITKCLLAYNLPNCNICVAKLMPRFMRCSLTITDNSVFYLCRYMKLRYILKQCKKNKTYSIFISNVIAGNRSLSPCRRIIEA